MGPSGVVRKQYTRGPMERLGMGAEASPEDSVLPEP